MQESKLPEQPDTTTENVVSAAAIALDETGKLIVTVHAGRTGEQARVFQFTADAGDIRDLLAVFGQLQTPGMIPTQLVTTPASVSVTDWMGDRAVVVSA